MTTGDKISDIILVLVGVLLICILSGWIKIDTQDYVYKPTKSTEEKTTYKRSYNYDKYYYKSTTKEYTTKSSYSYTPKRKSYKSYTNDDPYNAKEYSNEEDFYDDHYDDFFDYYDAESYYNEHSD